MGMRLGHEAASWERRTPAWLGPLLGAEFFKPCAAHPYLVKNECNHYCLDCAGEDDAVCCTLCVSAHRDHHVVQLDGMVSDPNLTFIVDPRCNREDPGLETEEEKEEEDDNDLPGGSNRRPGWISYRRRPRKGVPERAPFY